MKKQIFTMLTGLLIGAALTGGSAAVAAGIMAERSHHRVVVDGKEVQMEAYVINGNNYVKLRDMGKTVGFEVFWDSDAKCVQVKSGIPYTGEAPAKAEPDKPESHPEPAVPANDADVDAMKQDIVDRTNALRKENGIAALTADDKLMQAAQVRAEEMAASGVYSHIRPDGRKYMTVTDSQYIGENIHCLEDWALKEKSLPETVMVRLCGASQKYDQFPLRKHRCRTCQRYGRKRRGLLVLCPTLYGYRVFHQLGGSSRSQAITIQYYFCKMRTGFTVRISILNFQIRRNSL